LPSWVRGQRVADEVLEPHCTRRAQRIEIGHDQPDQRAIDAEQRDLLDQRVGGIDRFDRLGKQLLTVGEDDGLGDPRDDREKPVAAEPAEIAGAEPAVRGEGPRARGIVAAIAREHAGALRLDLADAACVGVGDAQRDAAQSLADRSRPHRARPVEGENGRGLGQAVAGHHVPAESRQHALHVAVERGAARHQQAQVGREAAMQRGEQLPPDPRAEKRPQP
jgi:hypothetical protein